MLGELYEYEYCTIRVLYILRNARLGDGPFLMRTRVLS